MILALIVTIKHSTVSLPPHGLHLVGGSLQVRQVPGKDPIGVLLPGGEKAAFSDQKRVCRDAHGRVMVEPPPPTPWEVVEADLVF